MRKKIILPYLFLVCWFGNSNAQEIISSAGACFENSGITLSCTLGEPVVETVGTSEAILTQGFHQSNLVVTAIESNQKPLLQLSVFPNPVDYELNLKVEGEEFSNLHYRLYDLNGKQLLSKYPENSMEKIDMKQYVSGSYVLHVLLKNGDPVQSFKIIKR